MPLRSCPLFLTVFALCLTGCRQPSAKEPTTAGVWKEFSGARAFAHVERLVGFGPRPSGSDALEASRRYLEEQLRAVGWQVQRQTFTESTPRGPLTFVNLIARRADASERDSRAIVCAHYDTKWYAADSGVRFVGANDGGSGTGALVELARALNATPGFARRFELVFFDGEEAIRAFTATDGLFGSRHYARVLRENGRAKQFRLGVLWDMMGDRELNITLPSASPPKLARGIFAASEALGTRGHFGYYQGDILDDHVPLNQAGIPTIDLIDFDFPAWHTPADTLDKVSAESLQIVGQATLHHLGSVAGELD
jgi:glutaminyl-peptide cyclotransferase